MNRESLAKIQEALAKRVVVPPKGSGFRAKTGDMIFSLDAQYDEDKAYVGLDVRKYNGENVGTFAAVANVEAPYVPHFFCFREGPPLLKLITAVQDRLSIKSDLIIVDGHGIAHPRRFGLACWVGVHTDTPSIGCAKEGLIWHDGDVERKRGKTLLIEDLKETVGAVLVTQDNTKPVFVSPGHKVSLPVATQIILHFTEKYRICEPLRNADRSARAYAKGVVLPGVVPMGELDRRSL